MPETLTYQIIYGGHAIQCLLCNSISWHPDDIEQRYCGNCHLFHHATTAAPQEDSDAAP